MPHHDEYVWLPEERLYARLVNLGAYASRLHYTKDGIDYYVTADNEEFEYFGDYGIDYDTD